jgi:hypothetical protein
MTNALRPNSAVETAYLNNYIVSTLVAMHGEGFGSAKRKVGADSGGSTPTFRSTTRVRRSGKPPNTKFHDNKVHIAPSLSYDLYNMHYSLLQFQPSKSIQNKIRIRTSQFYLKIILPSRAMQFFAVLLPVATVLATTANAADCSSDSGSQTCLNSTDLLYSRWVS